PEFVLPAADVQGAGQAVPGVWRGQGHAHGARATAPAAAFRAIGDGGWGARAVAAGACFEEGALGAAAAGRPVRGWWHGDGEQGIGEAGREPAADVRRDGDDA